MGEDWQSGMSPLEHMEKSSRLPGFYELPISDRRKAVARFSSLDEKEQQAMANYGGLTSELMDVFIENAVGSFSLPLGIATNFVINGQDVLVPMAVEETSVLAAASHGAKLARAGSGFATSSTDPVMTGQIQIFPHEKKDYDGLLKEKKAEIIRFANESQPRLLSRGGGAKDLHWRYIEEIQSLVLYLDVDTRDAMGANIVNTMCERVSGLLAKWIPCEIGLRILTNLCDKRVAKASCLVPKKALDSKEFSGEQVALGIEKAYLFAVHDVYRAATHNKGVMNGIDPVVIATGNDWRAVEAGAHAYCCRSGVYKPMTHWYVNEDGDLCGSLELPMAVGTVGGVTKLHPTAQAALKVMGNPSSSDLSEIICAVGLAQNLSALRALASEGIQKGHMGLHQKNLAMLNGSGVRH